MTLGRRAEGRLPTFLVVGAMKAGTTSLYHHLSTHPDVFMSPVKEPNFFAGPHAADAIGSYRRLFGRAGDARAVGEASTSYSRADEFPGVPSRIRALLPDVRLVYVLREPVARMCSMYHHEVLAGREHAPIDTALLEDPRYLGASLYARQIRAYLDHFDRRQLTVELAEDLARAPAETVRRISAFIGVDPDALPDPDVTARYVTSERRAETGLSSAVRRSPLAGWARRQLPERTRAVALRCLTTRAAPTDQRLSAEATARIRARLEPDLQQLGGYLGPGFSAWGLLTSQGDSTARR